MRVIFGGPRADACGDASEGAAKIRNPGKDRCRTSAVGMPFWQMSLSLQDGNCRRAGGAGGLRRVNRCQRPRWARRTGFCGRGVPSAPV